MAQESGSNWVPDFLPPFNQSQLTIRISDPEIVAETRRLASDLGMSNLDLGKKFISLGLLTAQLEQNPNTSIHLRDGQGFTERISLMAQQYSPREDTQTKYLKGKLELTLPSILGDEIMNIANKYHTTIEDALRQMWILGINMFRIKQDPNDTRQYYVEEKGKPGYSISL